MFPEATFALLDSPLVGDSAWRLVARALDDAFVPTIDDEHPPYWSSYARSAAAEITRRRSDAERLVLVAHSGAGALVPAVRQALGRRVDGYVFVDAGLPGRGESRLENLRHEAPEFADELEALFRDGRRFPEWTDEDLEDEVPDPATRTELIRGLKPRGRDFFIEPIPFFAGWPDAPCGYVQFTASYAVPASQAREHGWPYRALAGTHFEMLVEPRSVTDAIIEVTAEMLYGDQRVIR